jgi:hypothetical protein
MIKILAWAAFLTGLLLVIAAEFYRVHGTVLGPL